MDALLIVLFFFITAEFLARLFLYVLLLVRPNLFKDEFKPWTHSVKGGWIGYLITQISCR